MLRMRALPVAALTVLLALPGCRPETGVGASPQATATPAGSGDVLTRADMEMFLAVRSKALTRIEDAVTEVERQGGASLGRVVELSTAEQDAVSALGFDWRRYRWARDEIASLISAQRQREDSELLTLELTRARDDLQSQLKVAKDAASRQFLEAQVNSLGAQLEKLGTGKALTAAETKGMAVIEAARAELAVQQGRQDRVQKRVRELVQRERAGGPAAKTPAPAR